jgi:hypothetical protein
VIKRGIDRREEKTTKTQYGQNKERWRDCIAAQDGRREKNDALGVAESR